KPIETRPCFFASFDGRVVAKLPFVPLSYIQGLSHRNLLGEDYTDCSFIFLYILCTMSIRQEAALDQGRSLQEWGLGPVKASQEQTGQGDQGNFSGDNLALVWNDLENITNYRNLPPLPELTTLSASTAGFKSSRLHLLPTRLHVTLTHKLPMNQPPSSPQTPCLDLRSLRKIQKGLFQHQKTRKTLRSDTVSPSCQIFCAYQLSRHFHSY
ncbi:hypothetical protein CHARACLAT_028887, partial [Characodon lateralis]|nr:hypothetical protein [Characodon lateralis]